MHFLDKDLGTGVMRLDYWGTLSFFNVVFALPKVEHTPPFEQVLAKGFLLSQHKVKNIFMKILVFDLNTLYQCLVGS